MAIPRDAQGRTSSKVWRLAKLFPATPMLLAGVDRRFVENGKFTDNDTRPRPA